MHAPTGVWAWMRASATLIGSDQGTRTPSSVAVRRAPPRPKPSRHLWALRRCRGVRLPRPSPFLRPLPSAAATGANRRSPPHSLAGRSSLHLPPPACLRAPAGGGESLPPPPCRVALVMSPETGLQSHSFSVFLPPIRPPPRYPALPPALGCRPRSRCASHRGSRCVAARRRRHAAGVVEFGAR